MYLPQRQGSPELEAAPNFRLAVDQCHADLHDRVLPYYRSFRFVHAAYFYKPHCHTS